VAVLSIDAPSTPAAPIALTRPIRPKRLTNRRSPPVAAESESRETLTTFGLATLSIEENSGTKLCAVAFYGHPQYLPTEPAHAEDVEV